MTRFIKTLILGAVALASSTNHSIACTGISLTAADGSYVQARTIEWAKGALKSEYVIIPRGEKLISYTPTGANGMGYVTRYGVVGLAVVEKEFIAEGIGAQSTVCGGGRYDGLVHEIDEKQDVPSVGFGIGIERILYFLEKEGIELIPGEKVGLYVGILGKEARAEAYKLVRKCNEQNIKIYNGLFKTYYYQFMGPRPPKRKEER